MFYTRLYAAVQHMSSRSDDKSGGVGRETFGQQPVGFRVATE